MKSAALQQAMRQNRIDLDRLRTEMEREQETRSRRRSAIFSNIVLVVFILAVLAALFMATHQELLEALP